jgi:hypothetical protein
VSLSILSFLLPNIPSQFCAELITVPQWPPPLITAAVNHRQIRLIVPLRLLNNPSEKVVQAGDQPNLSPFLVFSPIKDTGIFCAASYYVVTMAFFADHRTLHL